MITNIVLTVSADPGVASSIDNFVEIDREIISTFIILLRLVLVSYKLKYVHEVLVKCLIKLALEKSVVRWTDCLDMTIAVDWDVKPQIKQNKKGHC